MLLFFYLAGDVNYQEGEKFDTLEYEIDEKTFDISCQIRQGWSGEKLEVKNKVLIALKVNMDIK